MKQALLVLAALLLVGAAFPQAKKPAAKLPVLYWAESPDTAETLKAKGITAIAVPPANAAQWRSAGFEVQAVGAQELEKREKLPTPKIAGRGNIASATRRPWIDANGWRLIRNPAGRYYYDLTGTAQRGNPIPLAIAEAFAYRADAIVKINPADLEQAADALRFLRELPVESYPAIADIGVIDDGSAEMGEVMNLFTRRNLLFVPVRQPSKDYRLNIKLGTKDFPVSDAADPSEFALKIRRQMGDDNRTLRIYGSETVIARYTGDSRGFRLHLLNYSGRQIDGLRIKLLRASLDGLHAWSLGTGAITVDTPVAEKGAVEFTIPIMGAYAVIDGPISY